LQSFYLVKKNKDEQLENQFAITADRACATNEVFDRQLQENSLLSKKMQQIENHTNSFLANSQRLTATGQIEIPVVVNVLYRTAVENISLAQIQSQIDVLNKDFNATNTDFGLVPSVFSAVKANVGITFVLDQVIRKSTTKTSWSTNDDMKRTSKGGMAAVSPTTKLNIWIVGKMVSGGKTILGYAQFPGGASSTDGVVMAYNYTGTTGAVSAPYNLGRTATHEVGHWMNLRHIWGGAACDSDLVADTPTHNGPNYGVPSYPHLSTCAGTPIEMTMNYMDYTDDRGMYMFSIGQKSRMDAIFAVGGSRVSFRL
jgi:hypothetical protein